MEKRNKEYHLPQKVSDSNPNLKPFAQYYTEGEGTYSCAVDQDNFIWIIWEDGSTCRGRINRLGFASNGNLLKESKDYAISRTAG